MLSFFGLIHHGVIKVSASFNKRHIYSVQNVTISSTISVILFSHFYPFFLLFFCCFIYFFYPRPTNHQSSISFSLIPWIFISNFILFFTRLKWPQVDDYLWKQVCYTPSELFMYTYIYFIFFLY